MFLNFLQDLVSLILLVNGEVLIHIVFLVLVYSFFFTILFLWDFYHPILIVFSVLQ